jgi:hypothetical protein
MTIPERAASEIRDVIQRAELGQPIISGRRKSDEWRLKLKLPSR